MRGVHDDDARADEVRVHREDRRLVPVPAVVAIRQAAAAVDRLSVPLFRLSVPLFRLSVPLFRFSVPLFRLSVPLFRLSVPLFRLSVPLFRLSVPLFRLSVPVPAVRSAGGWSDATAMQERDNGVAMRRRDARRLGVGLVHTR